MTTKPVSNHKPYLSFSRTETSLYLEAFVKHTRFIQLLVGFSFFLSAAELAVVSVPPCDLDSVRDIDGIPGCQSHKP